MILISIIAIVVGIVISKYYNPKTKVQKILISILAPFCMGLLILFLISASNTNEYLGPSLWENMGRFTIFVLLPALVLIITLLIALKVKKIDDKADNNADYEDHLELHYGIGKNRVNFEVKLNPEEIITMEDMRKQNPDKWKDNDLELIKEVKKQVRSIAENMSQPTINDFEKAKNSKMCDNNDIIQNKKTMRMKWYKVIIIIVCVIVAMYSVVATTVNSTIATCDNSVMINTYYEIQDWYIRGSDDWRGDYRCVKCSYSTFRRRMIGNDLYRQKIYNFLRPSTQKDYKNYDNFKTRLNISNNMINPFVWLW